jgi:hypothetical protein
MRAAALARFCLATGVAPSEAKALTRLEREEFLDQLEQMRR